MTTEHELLAAIAAEPDDDMPRLVYADWLMERGDPRGELIALQCALASASANDEPCDAAALDRERALFEVHAGAWIAPLVELAPGTYELRRGLVEHATLDRDVELDPLLAAAPLLRSVALRSQALKRSPTDAWSRLVALELVDVCYPEDANGIAAFAASPHVAQLRRLQLTNAQLGLELVQPLLQLDADIEHFGLSAIMPYQQRPLPGARLVEAIRWPLRSLYLGGCDFTELDVLARFPLERLALHTFAPPIARVIALAPTLPALTTLELDYTNNRELFDPTELLAALPALRRLRLRGTAIDDRHAFALAASPLAAQLRRLELASPAVTAAGIEAIRRSEHLRRLVWLRVGDVREARVLEPPPRRYSATIESLLRDNRKIAAIKEYRAASGEGLAQAKLAVERFAAELGLDLWHPVAASWL